MILKVEGVTVRLGSAEVLKNITFHANRGEMIAILGPNGSGKTTLLRTIFGILKPFKGVVYLDRNSLGYLPQEVAETKLKAIEVVLLGRTRNFGAIKIPKKEDYEIAIRALKEVGVEHLADRTFSELSGGEKQKVLIARLLAQQPEILLLDEPTAHLDISAQIEIMTLLRELANNKVVIVAMHDINLALSFASKVMMMKNGEIRYAGKPSEVISEESIREVFGIEVIVKKQGRIYVVPRIKSAQNGKLVHVICGGGSGRALIEILRDNGYKVSAGVLNVLDSDWEAIQEIDGFAIDEAPFSEISEESFRRNLEAIAKADAVVLANLAIGRGNFKNLLCALKSAEMGKLVVVNSRPFAERNFYGEEAEKIYEEILRKARVVESEEGVLNALRELLHRR
ncbi:MAG: ABC transporter ATP-binding protein [Archaeoglobaceae archaeon]